MGLLITPADCLDLHWPGQLGLQLLQTTTGVEALDGDNGADHNEPFWNRIHHTHEYKQNGRTIL